MSTADINNISDSIYREIKTINNELEYQKQNEETGPRIQMLAVSIFKHLSELSSSPLFKEIRNIGYQIQWYHEAMPEVINIKAALEKTPLPNSIPGSFRLREPAYMNKSERRDWLRKNPNFFNQYLVNTDQWKRAPAKTFYLRSSETHENNFVLTWKNSRLETKQLRLGAESEYWYCLFSPPKPYMTLGDLIRKVVGGSAKSFREQTESSYNSAAALCDL